MLCGSHPAIKTRPWVMTLTILAIGAVGLIANAQETRPVKTVGILYDGPHPGGQGLAPERVTNLAALIEHETAALTRHEFDVRFPADKRAAGDWTVDTIRAGVDRMLADDDGDSLGMKKVGADECRIVGGAGAPADCNSVSRSSSLLLLFLYDPVVD